MLTGSQKQIFSNERSKRCVHNQASKRYSFKASFWRQEHKLCGYSAPLSKGFKIYKAWILMPDKLVLPQLGVVKP